MPSCYRLRMLHQVAHSLWHCKARLFISMISHDIIIRHRPCMAKCVLPSTLNSYAAGLVHFTKFCDDLDIPEEDQMLASRLLLSHFIASHGAVSVGLGSMKTWLEGICLWHNINEAPWHGGAILKKTLNGAAKVSPIKSIQLKHEPVTIKHLRSWYHHLELSNSFDIAVFAVAGELILHILFLF